MGHTTQTSIFVHLSIFLNVVLLCLSLLSAADLYITEHLDQFCCESPGLVYMVRMYAVIRSKATIHEKVMKYVLKDEEGNLRHPYDRELSGKLRWLYILYLKRMKRKEIY